MYRGRPTKEKMLEKAGTPTAKLTDKQKAFAMVYAQTLNGSQAIREAGYQCLPKNENRMSAELRRHPGIAAFIQNELDKKRDKAEITAGYVLDKLVKIVEATETDNPQSALRGLELIGKHLGMYRDKTEISGPDGEAIQMEQKVKENVDVFTSRIALLANRKREGNVSEFPHGQGEG